MAWTPDVRIPNQRSKTSPGLAYHRGRLYMVHQDNSSNDLWHSESHDGKYWPPDERIQGQSSSAAPALAETWQQNPPFPPEFEYQNAPVPTLHMVHKGSGDAGIWHSIYSTKHFPPGYPGLWDADERLDDVSSNSATATASYRRREVSVGQTLIAMAHRASGVSLPGDGTNQLYGGWIRSSRGGWRAVDTALRNQTTPSAPAIVWWKEWQNDQDSPVLHMVYRSDSNLIYHATASYPEAPPPFWNPYPIPGQKTKTAPALAFYRGKLHLVHLGDSSNTIWHSVWDGSGWSDNLPIPNQTSKGTPALAWSHGSLHMVHLDNSSNDLWHSTFTEPVEGYDLTPVRWSWREVGRPLEVVIQNQGNQPTPYESTPWVRVTFLARFAGEEKSDTPDYSYWIREQLMPGGTDRAFVTIPDAAWIQNVCYFKVHVNAGKWDYDADPTNDVLWGRCNR